MKPGRLTPSNFISAEASFAEWRKDPECVAAYNSLEEEFAHASSLIEGLSDADMAEWEIIDS